MISLLESFCIVSHLLAETCCPGMTLIKPSLFMGYEFFQCIIELWVFYEEFLHVFLLSLGIRMMLAL